MSPINLYDRRQGDAQGHTRQETSSTLSRLFNQSHSTVPIPGKFQQSSSSSSRDKKLADLFHELDINNNLLSQLNKHIDLLLDENDTLKRDYKQIKLELVHEMKQCKNIMDKYISLSTNYKDLKSISNDIFQINNNLLTLQKDQKQDLIESNDKIKQLELIINNLNIKLDEKDITINDLETQLRLRDQEINYHHPPTTYNHPSTTYNHPSTTYI